jgi:hypothetical protein
MILKNPKLKENFRKVKYGCSPEEAEAALKHNLLIRVSNQMMEG